MELQTELVVNDKITALNSCQKNVFYFKRHKQPQKSFEKLFKKLFICASFSTSCVIFNFILPFWEVIFMF